MTMYKFDECFNKQAEKLYNLATFSLNQINRNYDQRTTYFL